MASEAAETDQFLAWKKPLKVLTQIVNDYLNKNAQEVIAELNKNTQDVSCKVLVENENKPMTAGAFLNVIEEDVLNDPEIERLPKENSRNEIINQTIFRNVLSFRFKIFGKTIRVNRVRIGVDKMGHFLHEGETYYHLYKKSLSQGLNEIQALEKIVQL